jgi:lipopolysaccharide transport system ATP-binding protein
MKPIIKVENLGKRYRIGKQRDSLPTLRDALSSTFRAPLRGLRGRFNNDSIIWALRNVSFEVRPGEVVGFIGANGAGKSTLFKLLSRVTEPTEGRAELYGKVNSLLEVGTGFHPELTGRENVYLNGSILGMSKAEITRKFDEIVAFAEIDKFLDTPVKRYSSGMYMRLAFAVAAHLEPEILMVDEVLAVGDASFQKKCLGKLGDVATEGRTVLFISHNLSAVQTLCDRVLWINNGKLEEAAETVTTVSHYLRAGKALANERVWNEEPPGNEKVRILRVCARAANGAPTDEINIQTRLKLEVDYWNVEPGSRISVSLHILSEQGNLIFGTMPVKPDQWKEKPTGLFRSVCDVPGGLLNDGVHRVTVLIVRDEHDVLFSLEDVVVFEVVDAVERRGNWHGKWAGAVRPDLEWRTEFLSKELVSRPAERTTTEASSL